MAKKDFTKRISSKNLSSLIPTEEPVEQQQEREEKGEKTVIPKQKAATKKPLKRAKIQQSESSTETTVATFRVKKDNLQAVKALALWERIKIQEVFNDALEAYIKGIPANTMKNALAEFKKRNP